MEQPSLVDPMRVDDLVAPSTLMGNQSMETQKISSEPGTYGEKGADQLLTDGWAPVEDILRSNTDGASSALVEEAATSDTVPIHPMVGLETTVHDVTTSIPCSEPRNVNFEL